MAAAAQKQAARSAAGRSDSAAITFLVFELVSGNATFQIRTLRGTQSGND